MQDYRFVERQLLFPVAVHVMIDGEDKPLWMVSVGAAFNDAGSAIVAGEGRTLEVACKRAIRAMRMQIDRVNDAILVPVQNTD